MIKNKRQPNKALPQPAFSKGDLDMALSKDEILDAIAEMSVMDIVALVEAMEEKLSLIHI